MTDEPNTHRRVIEKCRETINGLLEDVCTQRERADAAMSEVRAKEATIDRLTSDLANCRQIIDKQYLRSMQFDTVIAERDRLTRELAEAKRGAADLMAYGATVARHLAETIAERDAARQERDAMKAMMPKPPYDADTLERAARGTYADRTVRGMARALLRLSPPSAPAQNITSDDVCNDAAWLLDPKTPIADVYAELRSMGVDPEAVAERGAAFVADLMAKKAPAQSRALDAERTQLEVDDD